MVDIKNLINQNYVSCELDEEVGSFFGKLRKKKSKVGFVYSKGKYVGVISKHFLLRTSFSKNTKITNFVKHVPKIKSNTEIIEAAYLMFGSDCFALAVEEDKKIVGMISALDILKEMKNISELKKMKVSEVKYNPNIMPLGRDEPISRAITMMQKRGVYVVPIVDKKGALEDVVTIRDLLFGYYSHPMISGGSSLSKGERKSRVYSQQEVKHPRNIPISNFVSKGDLVTCEVDDSLGSVAKKMVKNKVLDVILVDGAMHALGIVSTKHLIRAIASLKNKPIYNLNFVGFKGARVHPDALSIKAKKTIHDISATYAKKISRLVHNEFKLKVHIKPYSKGGKKKKFSFHVALIFPGRTFSCEQSDWDLSRALRKTFENLVNSVKKGIRN